MSRGLRAPGLPGDAYVMLAGVVTGAAYLVNGTHAELTRDQALYGYSAQTIVQGVPAYEGVFNRAGPLAHLITAVGVLLARAVGIDDLAGMRLWYLLIAAVGGALLYLAGRDLFSSRILGLVTAATMLAFVSYGRFAANGPQPKTIMVVFTAAAIWTLVRRRWVWTGLLIGAATLTWQPVFFLIGPAAAVTALCDAPRQRSLQLRSLLKIAAGGVLSIVLVVAYFLAVGALRTFIDSFLLINAEYTRQVSFITWPGRMALLMWDGYGVALIPLFAGPVALIVLAYREWRTAGRRDEFSAALVGLVVGGLAGGVWSIGAFNGYADAFQFLPLSSLGTAAAIRLWQGPTPTRRATSVAMAWTLLCLAISVGYAATHRTHTLDQQRASVRAVFGRLPDDATIMTFEAPVPLVLGNLPSPSRYLLFSTDIQAYLDDTWPGGMAGFTDWITRTHPTVITVDNEETRDFLAPVLARDYVDVGDSSNFTWYVARSVDPRVRAAIADGVAAARE